MIRLAIPSIDADDLKAACSVLASGNLVQGTQVAAFEEALARYVGARHAVATSSCTSALHLTLLGLGIGPGDDVIVPAFSWIATANVVEVLGARPVFVDIDPKSYCLSGAALDRLIRDHEDATRIRAVMPVHAFGHMADMPSIHAVADAAGLIILEDAACALGASLEGRHAGTWGTAGCFSFHPRKTITTGEGGVVLTDDACLAEKLRALRNHGQDPGNPTTDFILPGFNARMTEIQAGIGISQLAKLERLIQARRRLALRYNDLLRDSELQTPSDAGDVSHAVQAYVVLLPPGVDRDAAIAVMRQAGIETTLGTWHLPLTTYYRNKYGHQTGDFPVTDAVYKRSLTLPLYESMTAAEQQRVVDALFEAVYATSGY